MGWFLEGAGTLLGILFVFNCFHALFMPGEPKKKKY